MSFIISSCIIISFFLSEIKSFEAAAGLYKFKLSYTLGKSYKMCCRLICIKITLGTERELTQSIKKLTLKHLYGNCITIRLKF